MYTREQINEILRPWDSSLDERPSAIKKQFAYDIKDRERAYVMAYEWHGVKDVIPSPSCNQVMADFICHQSDVIEMLAHALSFANKREGGERINMNEARLLTLIEVIQIALTVHQDSIVWREAPLDSDRHNIGDVNIGWGMPMVMNNSIVFYEFGTEDEDAPPLMKYGQTWRCWSWKPTEAQKQAAKWERNDVIDDIKLEG